GEPAAPATPIKVEQNDDAIAISNGTTEWRVGKKGTFLINSVSINGNVIAKDGKLICILEDRSDYDKNHTTREQNYQSQIDSVTLEQSGPVRAVVKITGKHKAEA